MFHGVLPFYVLIVLLVAVVVAAVVKCQFNGNAEFISMSNILCDIVSMYCYQTIYMVPFMKIGTSL
jgi:hypothetical protein